MQKATYTGSFLSLDVFLHVHSAVPQGPWRLTYTGRCRVWLLHVATLISEKGLDFTHLLEIWVGIGHVSCLYGLKMFESQPNSQFYFGFWQYRTWFILIFNFTSQYLGKVGRNSTDPSRLWHRPVGQCEVAESHQICRSKKLVPGCSWMFLVFFYRKNMEKPENLALLIHLPGKIDDTPWCPGGLYLSTPRCERPIAPYGPTLGLVRWRRMAKPCDAPENGANSTRIDRFKQGQNTSFLQPGDTCRMQEFT